MKKYLLYFVALLFSSVAFSQTGINTHNPQATLDVVGEPTTANIPDGFIPPRITGDQLEAKTAYTPAQTGAVIYVTSPISSLPSSNPQTVNVTASGYYYFNGTVWVRMADARPKPSIYEGEATRNWSLLSLSIGGTSAGKIDLNNLTPKFGGSNIDTDGDYVAPSTGYYIVKYEWRPEAGLTAGLLGDHSLYLSKNGTDLLAEKNFSSVTVAINVVALNLTLANIPVSSTLFTYMVHLDKNDQLNFGVSNNAISLGLLNNATVSVYVYKISN